MSETRQLFLLVKLTNVQGRDSKLKHKIGRIFKAFPVLAFLCYGSDENDVVSFYKEWGGSLYFTGQWHDIWVTDE